MNSLPPLSLPRFHVNKLSQAQKEQSASAQAALAGDSFEMPSEETPEPEMDASSEAPVAEAPLAPPMPPEIDTGVILNRLEAAVDGLERSALNHSQKIVSDFLRAAFPRLVESFLAEEVAAAIDAMAPSQVETLTLSVPSAFEASFQQAIQASPHLAQISDVRTHGDTENILVDIDWAKGGLQFDMSQFLESSLGRLTGPTPNHEGHNV